MLTGQCWFTGKRQKNEKLMRVCSALPHPLTDGSSLWVFWGFFCILADPKIQTAKIKVQKSQPVPGEHQQGKDKTTQEWIEKFALFFLQMALRLGGVPAALLNFSLQVNKSNLAQCWFHRCWQEDPAVYPRKVGNNENFLLRSQSCPLSFINPLSINYPHFLSSPPRGHCSSSAMLPNGFCLQGFSLTRNSCF